MELKKQKYLFHNNHLKIVKKVNVSRLKNKNLPAIHQIFVLPVKI